MQSDIEAESPAIRAPAVKGWKVCRMHALAAEHQKASGTEIIGTALGRMRQSMPRA